MEEKTFHGERIFAETENYYLSADDTKVFFDKFGEKHILHRLVAKKRIPCKNRIPVFEGEHLGYIESPLNVRDNAIVDRGGYVYGTAVIGDDALVYNSKIYCDDTSMEGVYIGGTAVISKSMVHGYAIKIGGNARIDRTQVHDAAKVFDAKIYGDGRCMIHNYATIEGDGVNVYNSIVSGNSKIHGNATVVESKIFGTAEICDKARVETSMVYGKVCDNAVVERAIVDRDGIVCGEAHIYPVIVKGEISETPQINSQATEQDKTK